MSNEKELVYWDDEVVGTVSNVYIDMFYLSGVWVPFDSEKSRRFHELLEQEVELVVRIGDLKSPARMGRAFTSPDDEIQITLTP